MKAFIINRYGKKENLQSAEIAEPVLRANDVLVQIHAASVNILDSKIKNGDFKLILPYKPPITLGHDVAGIVIKVGLGVKQFKTGDEVYARPSDHRIGTFAELIAINENDVALKPGNFSMEEAASIPLVGLTAWQALVEKANVKKGQKVFIQAGSGGVGTFAIQLAKHLGATVATTTSASNIDLVKSLGADIVINYRKEDFETLLKDYDIVLNSQDAKTLEKSLRILKPGGKLISISGPPDPSFAEEIKAPWFMKLIVRLLSAGVRKKAKRLNVSYSFLFMRAEGTQLGQITSLIDAGIIKPVIDKVFPFEQTNEAMGYVETGRAKGKVVIKIK
ncbi:NADP-dependent oxidoreductase [Pseudobacter ginsenosidimutans]|uniref:NADPH:quinone reductase-like Zn-dependent oxidoreductase n=1 Tax=Pseudobacter ginsenosidimutans TaxID=661488 RepID=A0A4Q7MCI2_9BACT|nr:NADP-dependent oxidoreductase [Pseudobacter ginsenosidimutans]QEC42498.1 NADP-dependent oxidoreductase [Pseudobacter ginsenosidimutans]RZS64019.1 NADPH:quinone reductase-like Zn-dependent oxidoreductase [Pseudobacter ginsenosidimutans]